MEGRWFQERKEILIRELVASFVEAWCTFNALYRRQKDEGKPHYAAWESWIGTENRKGHLWRLKDLSQSIVRRPGSNPSMHEVLLDWTLGAIFHECLKIREDLFQLSHPLDVGEKTAEDELPDYRALVARAEKIDPDALSEADQLKLRRLPFKYVESRHRLGLIDEARAGRILATRRRVAERLERDDPGAVEFHRLDVGPVRAKRLLLRGSSDRMVRRTSQP